MQYNAPFGNTNMDAPYVNGDPSIGLMGSIPPAASIEYPQREITNFINRSGFTPTNADLLQLGKSVQSGFVNYGLDVGAPNDIQINPTLPVDYYTLGQRFIIKLAHGSTSQVTVNVSGLGKVPLIHTDQSPMNAYELVVGQMIEVAFDGTHFQMIAGGAYGGIVTMTAPRFFYVSDSIGSDTLYDGTAAVIGGVMGGPFKTIQKALATMQKYNLGGWTFTINIADGTYSNAVPIDLPLPNGSGKCNIVGNNSNPAAVVIYNTGTGSAIYCRNGGQYIIGGCTMRTTMAKPGDNGDGIWIANNSDLQLGHMHWGFCYGSHLDVGPNGTGFVVGNQTIDGPAGQAHQQCFGNGILYNNVTGQVGNNPILTITNPATTFGNAFIWGYDGGGLRPIWEVPINGFANVTGSKKFNLTGNAMVQSGARGVNYEPGDTAGTVTTGGQYL